MLLYRFERKSLRDKLIVYENPMENDTPSGSIEDAVILSCFPETEVNGKLYIEDALTGRFIAYDETKFNTIICVESMVIPRCKRGLNIFDSLTDSKKEVSHLSAGGKIFLTLDFNKDNQGNIWARVCNISDEKYSDGYIVYKNVRNNFANVTITGTPITTVLTAGEIDKEKITTVRENNTNASLFSAGFIDLSTGTTTLGGNKKSISSKDYIRVAKTVYKNGKKKKIYTYKRNTQLEAYKKDLAENAPSIVQNNKSWPPVKSEPHGLQSTYSYNYTLNYKSGLDDLSAIYTLGNYNAQSLYANINKNMNKYNRFKLANPDDMLSRGYMHIFFTRPDCNILANSGGTLQNQVKNDPFIKFINLRNPDILKQLVLSNGSNHQFMMLLSNKAKGFSLTDDGINTETQGKSMSGYSVAYGRRRDSELGQDMNINYKETRDFDILNLHKIWIDYIINVYKGKWSPKNNYIQNKILDYPVSVYVIVTAEDFETVLFWTKYYGVFPVSIPLSAINWSGENSTVSAPDMSITYRYSWKEDLNPATLTELNMNAFKNSIPKSTKYLPIYNVKNGVVNNTWVGAPFIEVIRYKTGNAELTGGSKVSLKLRFRSK